MTNAKTIGVLTIIALTLRSAIELKAAIVAISEVGSIGNQAIVQTPFGEDAFGFSDRNHEYNGVAFSAAGTLVPTQTAGMPAGTVITGLPSYLLGQPYVAGANDNKTNANYSLSLTVDVRSTLYLLLDNRLGDNDALTPSSPALAGMSWVADRGFTVFNTGLSPNSQPDFVGMDETSPLVLPIPDPSLRTHSFANLGVGPGISLNNFFTVYAVTIDPGTITLGAQNDTTSRNFYGVVVASAVPETGATCLLLGSVAFILFALQRKLCADKIYPATD
jgi:hypothetical protein